ncbi:MAG TPA: hypothetical protein VIY51_24270 [Xanthobacteraceae bacterium]
MKSKQQPTRREPQNLAVRYGEIGISAVAAAMRYQGDGKGLASPERDPDRWLEQMAPEIAV